MLGLSYLYCFRVVCKWFNGQTKQKNPQQIYKSFVFSFSCVHLEKCQSVVNDQVCWYLFTPTKLHTRQSSESWKWQNGDWVRALKLPVLQHYCSITFVLIEQRVVVKQSRFTLLCILIWKIYTNSGVKHRTQTIFFQLKGFSWTLTFLV